jgi:hypothetical protein
MLMNYWLEKYSQEGRWLSGRSIRKINSVEELVGYFKESIKGAVVYDPKVAQPAMWLRL